MASITVDLEAAGLTHAKGKTDRCNGEHEISMLSVTLIDDDSLVSKNELYGIMQSLHSQAHPDGTASWTFCRQPGCADAYDILSGTSEEMI